jgi:hypothetical protein
MSQSASGNESFVAVFDYCRKLIEERSISDFSIIFFTDGCDTCNTPQAIYASLNLLKEKLDSLKINSRFLTVGFTSYHNAKLLGDIANAGSDVGNFIYVDTN